MRVKGAVAVVTGASSGIGRATALRFARHGAAIVLAARGQQALEQVARECESAGAQVLAVPTDVTDPKMVEGLGLQAVEAFDRIDVWVNNASVTMFSPFLETPLEDFRRVLEVNVMGYVYGARTALPRMKEQGSGVLVNVSSILAVVPQPYTHAYCMSKAATKVLSASLRQELKLEGRSSRDIKVVSVLTATADTPIFDHAANYTGREVKAMPPVYSPERVAHTIVDVARAPRREVIVGPTGRGLVMQTKVTPGLVERMMAAQVDMTHLSRTKLARRTEGNLYKPEFGTGSIHGRWNGKQRTAFRRLMSGALVAGIVHRVRRRGG